jgi:hypothetical protein
MRNTQMNSVVYGDTFHSIHLYCVDRTKDHQARNNLKYKNIKYYILFKYLQYYCLKCIVPK